MILTPENIATLRHAAYSSQNRRSDEPRAVVTFTGGPLDGIRLSVLQRAAVSPSMAFCTATDTMGEEKEKGSGTNGTAVSNHRIDIRLRFPEFRSQLVAWALHERVAVPATL